ncbi:MAG TPA: FkbM family methyltransferase [Salinivirgaceae bacterium]|nr:FkbM family methyltransferase [Salinivirgaceae bacterium]
MLARIKNLIKGKKEEFRILCRTNNLTLNYKNNRTELEVLKSIFYNREYADYFPFYKKATIVDIGAHFGYFSIFTKNNLDKESKIIAVEPNKSNFTQLQRNVSDCNINNISCYNYAIGDKNGISKLYQGLSPNHSIIDSYNLSDNNKYEEVEVKTLEGLVHDLDLNCIDFLKMDCEGAEYSIFNSTPDSVFDKITTISMEFHDLKDKRFTAENLVEKLIERKFKIVKFCYEKTSMNLNYGKLIGTKIFSQ